MVFILSPNDMNELLKLYKNSGDRKTPSSKVQGANASSSPRQKRKRLFIEATSAIEKAF